MKILMCKPRYYNIEYEINPWMNKRNKSEQVAASMQWRKLYERLLQCGADVELMDPVKGLPDMVFTANAGLFIGNEYILSQFKHKERRPEQFYYKQWFTKQGFEQVDFQVANPGLFFEGEGDALFAGENKLFVGYGLRSDRAFYEELPEHLSGKIIFCELIDPYFYHLDTCFCPLNAELALWWPEAFSSTTQQSVRAQIQTLDVPQDEAQRFACNSVVLKNQVVMPSHCPETKALLEAHGFTVHTCEMSEFMKAGGACKCLTLLLDRN